MKNKKGQSIPQVILDDQPNPIVLINDIKNLTVEDIVVIYAYAEAIVETVREPLIILDENLRIKTANKSFFDDFKVTKKETYNKLIFDLGNGQWDIPELKKLLKEILPKNSHFEDFEVTHTFEDIGTRTMILNARRIVLEGRKTELVLLAIEDITQKKIIDKHKDDFIAIATHELKTPLTSIKSFVQILQKDRIKTQNEKSKFMLNKIAKQVYRMEHMMESFLNVYTLQTGKLELRKERFIMEDLLKDILETFQYAADTHTITLEGKKIGKMYADKERIGQVITNLLTNAIKYSPSADKVLITTNKKAHSITVSVRDFGMGIPKEQQNMIFERFYRVQTKNKKKVEGLGLGLYISHEIIKEHRGKMWVESKFGKGSTFCFTLPLK
ncbi:MAG TPA: ATP-binding protein [Candidatus Nitrosocosmicus sp.]|nr:ATP-binding protein [Candidatus Nitrosocosmicus sp.]